VSEGLTDRQAEVLQFINAHRAAEQCNPTCAEIAQWFGWASPNAAKDHLWALGKKGVIEFRHGKSRGYKVVWRYAVPALLWKAPEVAA
jgi:repressor LexA